MVCEDRESIPANVVHHVAPAPSEAQQYEYRTYTDGIPGDALEESKYMGEPNDENEENWARLRRRTCNRRHGSTNDKCLRLGPLLI